MRSLVSRRSNQYMSNFIKSYVKSGNFPPLLDITISKQLELTAERWPDQLACISQHQGASLNYQQLYEKAKRLAANLIDLGVKRGDRVGIYAPNCIEWYLIQMACALSDSIFVTINPAYKVEDLRFCLNNIEINLLITTNSKAPSRLLDNIEKLLEHSPSEGNKESSKRPELPHLRGIYVIDIEKDGSISNGNVNLNIGKDQEDHKELAQLVNCFSTKCMDAEPSAVATKSVDSILKFQNPKSPINIQFTSGTTGLPKGAQLTHRNILNNGFFIAHEMGYTREDRIVLPVPLYHCFGLVMGNLAALTSGATIIYPNLSFNAEKTLQAVETYKGTTIYGVPTMFMNFLNQQEKSSYNLTSLQKGIMAGSICPEHLLSRVNKELNIAQLAVCYGMTETSPVSFMTRRNDSQDQKTTTVGKLMKHLEAKVVDEQGNILPTEVPGELLVKGYSIMAGYYNNPDSNKVITEGWMKTGDLGTINKDGYLKIVGRIKDIIIRGGENIAPMEIENQLLKMTNVDNVQVFGVPDAVMGEEICAFIQLKDKDHSFDPKSVLSFLKNKLAHYKVPKYVCVVDQLPITVTGKPQKFKMREDWLEISQNNEEKEKFRIR